MNLPPFLQRPLMVLGSVLVGSFAGVWLGPDAGQPQPRAITVKARQYAYDPPIIEANRGDEVTFKMVSMDVIHGFFLEGYDLDVEIHPQQKTFLVRRPSKGKEWTEVEEVTVRLDRPGKFRYRCSHTCGTMHPFMVGELIVAPNRPLHAGVGGTLGLLLGLGLFGIRSLGGGRKKEAT